MKKIDVRFTKEMIDNIKWMLGKKLNKYKCDPFIISTSVYGLTGILVENRSFAFTNFVEVMDYYGEKEDVGIFKMLETPFNDIQSLITDQKMIEMPVNDIIDSIDIVNENQQLIENNILIYDIWLTRGIIFKLNTGNELSFEKSTWFSEDISVEKGYNLIERFASTQEFIDDWSSPYSAKCHRSIITLKE